MTTIHHKWIKSPQKTTTVYQAADCVAGDSPLVIGQNRSACRMRLSALDFHAYNTFICVPSLSAASAQ